MHYYIYPKNWDGEDIVFNLSLIDKENTYSFIDDKEEEISLKNLAAQIKSDSQSLVLIASKYRYFDLAENLESYGISHYVDGLKFCASKLSFYYSKKIAKRNGNGQALCVGLLVTQLPHSEHSRSIISKLQEKNLSIVFIVTDKENFARYSQNYPNEYCLLVRCDLLGSIDFITIAHATTHYVKFHSNVISILNPQGLLDPVQNYFYMSREKVDMLIGSRVNFDYVFCHTKAMREFYQNKLAGSCGDGFLSNPLQFIPMGYPSLDSYLRESYCDEESNTILLAFTISNIDKRTNKDECGISCEILCDLVQSLLDKKYKVVLRPHPEKCKAIFMEEVAKKFENVGGGGGIFVYDTSPRMSKKLMEEAFAIIGHGSSVMQTFPLATCKPAILFIPDKEFFVRNDLDSKFVANQTTHYLTHSIQEVLEVCERVKSNAKIQQQEIENYRRENVYNLGHSGEAIANFIEKLILKVANDCKQMENG